MTPETATAKPRLYGRRKGRPLRVRKTALMRELLPHLQIALPKTGKARPASWFDAAPQHITLEIGFGDGGHLAAQAARHPDTGFIGCEPFLNGIAGLLKLVEQDNLNNIRIWPDNAHLLLQALPDASLDRVYILFADPWPKKRHRERRFVQPDSLAELARVMKPGAPLTLASDDPVLQEWLAEQLAAAPVFIPASGITKARPENWVETRYEAKALAAGRTPVYYLYRRA